MERNITSHRDEIQLLSRAYSDSVRGLAMLIIIFFHLFIAWDFPRVVNLMGSVSVAAFLILSGYGINESFKKNGLNYYWRKKLRRIILPFWLFILVLLPFRSDYSIEDFVLETAFIKSDFWFIPYLLWCYMLYWVLRKLPSRWFVCLFVIVAFLGLNLLFQIAAEQSLSFFIGVMVSQHIERLRNTSKTHQFTTMWLLFLVGLAFLLLKEIPAVHNYKGMVVYNYILLVIKLSLGLVIVLIPIFCTFMLHSRLLYLCGIASLELYLVHMAMVNHVPMQWLHVLLFVFLTVVLSFLYYQVNHKLIPLVL